MKRGRPYLSYALLLGALASLPAHAADSAAAAAPHETVPPPATTTLERMVNPRGLSEAAPLGWRTDSIGAGRGVFDASIGIKLWTNRFDIRSLLFGGTYEVAPGIRARANFRRREGTERAFEVYPDEVYLEGYNQYRAPNWQASGSLRFGHIRYLHVPYPDAIAQFDQVPGYFDLLNGSVTDYRSLVFVGETAANSGFGFHTSARVGGLLDDGPVLARLMEAYLFYRHDFGRGWRFETRLGEVALRREPLGRGAQPGGDLYLGKQLGEFNLGLLYENKRSEHEYAGIMVQFRPGSVTRALGRYSVDYSRLPEGFTAQIPLIHTRLRESRFVRDGDVLVGEVRAVRIRTLWQQGYMRNEYEHRLESWGDTSDPRLRCAVVEEPWYLQTEALVSQHLTPDARWERDRQGPGQYVQRVTYRFYRAAPVSKTGA